MGFARATDFFALKDGIWTLAETLPPSAGAAIASLETNGKGIKVKFYDKLKVLELLGNYLGMFPEDAPSGSTGNGSLLEAILRSTAGEVMTDDLPELQQATAAGHELVESPGAESL